MKKALALLLSIVSLISFAACAKKVVPSDGSSLPDASSSPEVSSSQPDSSDSWSPEASSNFLQDAPSLTKQNLPNGVTSFSLDLKTLIPEKIVREFFPYGSSYYGLLAQSRKKDYSFGPTLELYFIDLKTGKVLDEYYTLDHDAPADGSHYVTLFENLDGYCITCDKIAYVISGSPETGIRIEKKDYNRQLEGEDSIIRSKDGKWYAYTEDDAVLVNTETGEKIIPYVGKRESEDIVTHTSSRPSGFSDDYFFFRTIGYEWANGYGTYNLKTGEIKVYDDLVDLMIAPSNANSNRFPYVELWDEFGYIDVSDPSKTVPLFNKNETKSGEIYEALKGSVRFIPINIGNGKYLCTFAEDSDNKGKFVAVDSESLKVVYSQAFDHYPSYYFGGEAVAFIWESVEGSEIKIVSLP